MRAPLSWLREYARVDATAHEIARRLNVSTMEVERVIEVGVPRVEGNLRHFVVGRVVSAEKHPNADRLQLCQVDVGNPDPQQIVCGAWNFGAGATVAVAMPGSVVLGKDGEPFMLGEAKLRGEVSRGMILAEDEIGLGADHDGIMLLPGELEPGTPLADVLPLQDEVLDVTTTMNRVDLLSMVGLAREVAALFGGELTPPAPADVAIEAPEPVSIAVDDFGGLSPLPRPGVPRRPGRAVAAVAPHATAPRRDALDLERRRRDELRHARLGEPAARIRPRAARRRPHRRPPGAVGRGDPHARRLAQAARPDRHHDHRRRGLGRPRRDHGRPRVGGDGRHHRGAPRGRQLRADRDSCARPSGSVCARRGRTGGRRASIRTWPSRPRCSRPGCSSTSPARASLARPTCTTACRRGRSCASGPPRTTRIVGLEVGETEQRAILGSLGFDVSADWDVTVPTWRARDVTREIDLVEEVARVVLDRVPRTMPLRRSVVGHLTRGAANATDGRGRPRRRRASARRTPGASSPTTRIRARSAYPIR